MDDEEEMLRMAVPAHKEEVDVLAERPGFGSVGKKVLVSTNHFRVDIRSPTIYQYTVSIDPELKSGVTKGAVFSELVRLHGKTALGNKTPAFDGRKSMYTASPLPFESEKFVITLSNDANAGGPRKEREHEVTIQFAKRIDLVYLQDYCSGDQRKAPRVVTEAVDVIIRASMSSCLTPPGTIFSTKFGPITDTREGLEFYKGCYTGVRLSQIGAGLNIDIPAAPFYKPIPVVEFVAEFLHRDDIKQPFSPVEYAKVERALRGVLVETTHRTDKIVRYRVKGLTIVPLEDLMFSEGDKENFTTTVVEYFLKRYRYKLEYIFWPCLQCGSSSREIYLPLEVCKIVQGQRYLRKLSTKQAAKLLKVTCERPHIRRKRIMKVRNNYTIDKIAQEFGMRIDGLPVRVHAHVLPSPTLKYHISGGEKTCTPTGGLWNMINKKLVNGGKVQRWACLNISKVPALTVQLFCGNLIKTCNNIGMDFKGQPLVPLCSATQWNISSALHSVHRSTNELLARRAKAHEQRDKAHQQRHKAHERLQLLIVILPEDRGYYGEIKRVCETELGIVTQCCLPKHVKTDTNVAYLENVALKINVKVGGRNTVLEQAFIHNGIPFLSEIPTIIFGADVSHPPPGVKSSSIAAVVASMDWLEVTTYKSVLSAQLQGKEIIENLFQVTRDPNGGVKTGMISEMMLSFWRKNRRKPERIVVYREGVGESQFSQVVLQEVDAIRKACLSLEEDYLPPITFVVVQKRHRIRFFPHK